MNCSLSVTQTFTFFKSRPFMMLRLLSRLVAKPFPHPAMTQWQQMESVSHAGDQGSRGSGGPATGQSETNMRIVIALLCASYCFGQGQGNAAATGIGGDSALDRKSTRLNSSHLGISYAV